MRQRILFLFLFAVTFSLPAWAYTPKVKTGINDGTEGSGIGGNESHEGTDVRLPIGLPFQYTDVSTGSGSSENGTGTTEEPARIVYSFDLTEEIGPASLRMTRSALEQARGMNAACVLIRINSYSGETDAAENIRKELANYDRPVLIYVDGKAVDAAALVSMSGDSVYMRKGSGIQGNSKSNKAVNSKNNFAATSKNNATLQRENCYRNPDASCIFSSTDAVRSHLANAETSNMNEVLERAGVTDCQIVYYSPGFFEKMIDWCMNPAVSLAILSLLVFAIRIQQRSSFPGPVTFLLIATVPLFCLPLYQGGLSNGIEILLLFIAVIVSQIPLLHRSSKRMLRLLPALLLLVSFVLCQSGAIKNSSLTEIGIQTLLSATALLTGWFLLPLAGKVLGKRNVNLHLEKEPDAISVS